jgi:hypothetical protein
VREPGALLLRIYRMALLLYPSSFRREYEQQLLLTLGDAHRDRKTGSIKFWIAMFFDLLKSAATEGILMLREQILRQPIWFYAFALGLVLTVLGGAAAVTVQQMLRRGANQPQAEMADFYASQIMSGMSPEDSIPPVHVNLESDLQPFVIFYDEQARPEKSTGYLDQAVPRPPLGVFEYARIHGSDTVTWQPRRGVRIAAVARYVPGRHPGYLLAGRSLRTTEEYDGLLRRMTFLGWFAVMLLLGSGAALLNRTQCRNATV